MNCPNCQSKITCGCQKRTATDGKQTCSNCVAAYNYKLKIQQKPANPDDITLKIQST